MPSEPEVRYVLSGQPTGWAAMGKEVREFDEEKVRNSKEDIDTLLVFAGLFSAVLSAFLVAAYPSLQLDRMDTVVYTLQVIAAQTAGYNLIGNTITSSTAPPPSLPPFKPSPSDIRVNVLWFASLVISLITASFGMLVKQWLREFLAVEVPSPQARLRIRHFREPQLKQWMVFEIAASLPLLLQLSLALFFVGLCYFTAAIHASIGYTTLPLVIGWALFFFTATALPIFFPRCPYRTALLKVAVARLHRALRFMSDRKHHKERRGLSLSLMGSIGSTRNIGWDTGSDPGLDPGPGAVAPSFPANKLYQMLTACKTLPSSILRNMLPGVKSLPDEREIVKAQDQDVAILVSVDAIQANDELLFTAMVEAFHYGRPDWIDAVDFVMHILAHRLPTVAESDRVVDKWPFSDGFPLSHLRPQVIEGVMKILSEYAADTPVRYRSIFSPWLGRNDAQEHTRLLCMFSVIVAAADVHIKFVTAHPYLLDVLRRLFTPLEHGGLLCKDWATIAMGKQATPNGLPLSFATKPVARLLRLMAKVVVPARISTTGGVKFIEALTAKKIENWMEMELDALPMDSDTPSLSLLESFLQALLLSDFQEHVPASFIPEWSAGHYSLASLEEPETPAGRLLSVILDLILDGLSTWQCRPKQELHYLSLIVELASRSESSAEHLLSILLDYGGPDGRSNSTTLAEVITDRRILDALNDFERADIAKQGVESFKRSISARSFEIDKRALLPLPMLRLCQAAMGAFGLVNITTEGRGAVRKIFTSLESLLRSSITASSGLHSSATAADDSQHLPLTTEIAEVAHACLYTMMLYQHNDNSHYEKDGPEFSEADSIFSDDLVEILMQLNTTKPKKPVRSFFRIRRIEETKGLLALEQIRGLWPDIREVTTADETTPIVNTEGVDNSSDTGSRDHYNVDGPSNNFTDIHAHEGTTRVIANKDPGDDVEHFGPSNVNPSPDVDGHTDVHPAVSPHAYEDGVHEGEAAESVEDDTPSTTRSDREDNPVAQYNQTPTTLDMGLADVVEREETRLLLADIYEHEGTARTTVNEDSKDNVDHPNFSNANNSPDRGSQIGADLAAASPHVPGDATLEHEPAQPADDTLGSTTQARPDDQDGQVAQHGSVSETSSVGANDTAERLGVEG